MHRIALVTGSSTGIGLEIVKLLSGSGIKVIATYNSSSPTYEHADVIYRKLDVTDHLACHNFLEELAGLNIKPDILINNAGIVRDSMFHKMKYEDWYHVINVNLLSLFNLTQPVFNMMKIQGYGRIVNISSVNANKGQIGQVNYCAAKAGIQGFTKALALEGARYGVTVNTISPGYTDTKMMKEIKPEILDKIIDAIPLKRLCKPEEIADLTLYLTSEHAAYVTGANYEINGGLYLS
ncbi:3-ketoacyl-ACP reductase [Shewanella sp. Sh95]|uniref:3-oxoacyl-ACP reductase n=1 Tax=Shewanella sp. Sh95 TaxID=1689868 RepID=UPI0006DAB879|nr:3-oxoacyl-ACP reductase [Shewanella sp. Sh95]KPN77491.1 3-ketoacyl-ACP reductase [Shewanella sp. Sh95]